MKQSNTGKIGEEDMDKTNNDTENSSTSKEDEHVPTKVCKEITVTQEFSSDNHGSSSKEEDNSNDSDYVEEEGENLINIQEMVTQDRKIWQKPQKMTMLRMKTIMKKKIIQ